MKVIMKNAVDRVYQLPWLREKKPQELKLRSNLGESYTTSWDDPRIAATSNE